MFAIAFIDKCSKPTDDELAAELGASTKLWKQLVSDLASESGVDIQEWKSVSQKFPARLLRVHSVGNLRARYGALQTQRSQARQLWSQSYWCLCARPEV